MYTLDAKTEIVAHFAASEIACPHCGLLAYDRFALAKLSRLREIIGHPVVVTSGTRCPAHNAEVGGHPNSGHLYGTSFDIFVPGGSMERFKAAGIEAGFSHVAEYTDGHIHLGE